MSDDKQEPLELSQVHTSCRNCVFAKYDKDEQVGCGLEKLKDYENAGIPVISAYDGTGKKFEVINGRFCMFYRSPELMEKLPRDTWEEIVKLQTKVPYHAILFVEKGSNFKTIKAALKKLHNQEQKPNLVSLINKQYLPYSETPEDYIKPSDLLELLNSFNFHQFSLKNVWDDGLDDRALVDLAYDSNKEKPYPFYVSFSVEFDIPENFSKELNDAVLIKMMQIGVAKPVEGINGLIVSKITHKKHGGNSFAVNLEDKVSKYEEDSEKFIYEAIEICPSLKR